jgi:G:T-mismatch repair DNA endonuclease (very short patch repair protein)
VSAALKGKYVGEKHHMFGKHLTPEARAKRAEAFKGKRSAFYGKHHTAEAKAKISEARKDKKLSQTTRLRMSTSRMGRTLSPEARDKLTMANLGKKHTLETRRKISEAQKGERSYLYGKHRTPEIRAKISQGHKGKHLPPEQIAKMSGVNNHGYGKHLSPEHKNKISVAVKGEKNGFYGQHHTPETRARMKVAWAGEAKEKLKAKWADPIYKANTIRNNRRAQGHKQTKPEKMLEAILNEILPNEYKYVGSTGEVIIAGVLPDFINVNGKKKIIECFGNWWHGEKRTGKTKEEAETERIEGFKKYGFGCLILWESEIKNEHRRDEVVGRILAFHSSKSRKGKLQLSLW